MSHSITITLDDIQNYGKTLMLRGFAEFISWKYIKNSSDYHHTCIVQDLVKVIKSKKIETLVWDGDLYRSDSFTHLIFELMKKLPENTKFVAYKPKDTCNKFINGDKNNCELGWCEMKTDNRIDISLNEVQLPDGLQWFEKNTLLTKYIYSDVLNRSSKLSVLYIGGGRVIKNEMENINKYIPECIRTNVKIQFIDIPRASFSINDEGVPLSKIQYLGNSNISVDPLDILPLGYFKNNQNKNIELNYSKIKYFTEYKYSNN